VNGQVSADEERRDYGESVPAPDRDFTVLVSHWDGSWDVFVLDPVDGLLGAVQAATPAEVEPVARDFLSARFVRPGREFRLVILGP
jgi:hypothetical protein